MKKSKTKLRGIIQCIFLLLAFTTFPLLSYSQNSISGVIKTTGGEIIPGATILIKGTFNGTISDNNGKFVIQAKQGDVLQVAFVGMVPKEILIGGQSQLEITMNQDVIGLEEVVAVGYGTMKKKDLTGSAVSAKINDFKESPNISIIQSLQGAVPGVSIGQINQAGEEPDITIRGRSTISGSMSVLIVVDGVIYRGNITDINPDDIQTVDVLKDASSKAIYGAQAANGVILITTKSGSFSKKPSITYSASISTQAPTVKTRLLNREEYLKKVMDVEYADAYLAPGYTETNPNWDFYQSELSPENLAGVENGTNYDWWGALTSPGFITDHNLSLTGGNENTTYFVSGGFTEQEGFIMNDNYSRSTIRINLQSKINNWLTLGTNTFASFADLSGTYPDIGNIALTSPLVSSKDENGNYVVNHLGDQIVNPFLNALADDKDLRNNISGNFFAIISIPYIKGLTYRINYNNNLRWAYHAYSNKYDSGQSGAAYKQNSSTYDTMLDNIFTYEKQLNNDHRLQVTLVAGYNKVNYESTRAGGENYSNLDLSYNSLQQGIIQTISSSAWKESSIYQMGRLNYNFRNKYLLTSTLRRDGFSGFAKNNKFGLFPSVGMGWVLTEESFFKIPKIDYLKLRASYGQNGNQTSRYSSLATVTSTDASKYVFGDGASTSLGQSVNSLANNNLTWESTTGLNAGIDFSVFNNRISGNIEYYNTTTSDLLWNKVLPLTTGFSQIKTNLGKIVNTGFEISIAATPVKTSDVQWDLSLNFSTNKNEIKELLGVDNDGDGKEDDLVASGLFIGKSIGAIYDYEVNGIWQIGDEIPAGYFPGTYRIVDQDETDGAISAEKDRIFLGRTEPAFSFSIQNTLKYKNFSLRFFINSIQGGKDGYMNKNYPTGVSATTGTAQNRSWFTMFDYWSPSNPDAKYPQSWIAASIKPARYFSRDFIRLQDISLSYNIEKTFAQKIGIADARLYVSGKNLLTLTNWEGWDPETGQGIGNADCFPVMKAYTLGIEVSF